MTKRTITGFLCLILLLFSCSCDKNVQKNSKVNNSQAELYENMLEPPILLTSAGQSIDVYVAEQMLTDAKINKFTTKSLAYREDVRDSYKTLIIAVGGSAKGLGTAGLDEVQELERVKEVITASKEKNMQILVMHIGGSIRRGKLGDLFLRGPFSAADIAVIVSAGDRDGVIHKIISEGDTPGIYTNTQEEIIGLLEIFFRES